MSLWFILFFLSGSAASNVFGDVASLVQVGAREDPTLLRADAGDVDVESDEASARREDSLRSQWASKYGGLVPDVVRMLPKTTDEVSNGLSEHETKLLIPAIPRSGSTLLMEMVTSAVFGTTEVNGKKTKRSSTFALFEPCHRGDVVSGADAAQLEWCSDMLTSIFNCDFSAIQHLWGWNDSHTLGGPEDYSPLAAGDACNHTDIIALKTVASAIWQRPVSEGLFPLLDRMHSVKAVLPVRDPRGIFASTKRLFEDVETNKSRMEAYCNYYLQIATHKHPRLHVVRFEDMVQDPMKAMAEMYKFLGFSFGLKQVGWLDNHFWHTSDCVQENIKNLNFTTCRRGTAQHVVNKWKGQLTRKEMRYFRGNPVCRRMAQHFKYDADYP